MASRLAEGRVQDRVVDLDRWQTVPLGRWHCGVTVQDTRRAGQVWCHRRRHEACVASASGQVGHLGEVGLKRLPEVSRGERAAYRFAATCRGRAPFRDRIFLEAPVSVPHPRAAQSQVVRNTDRSKERRRTWSESSPAYPVRWPKLLGAQSVLDPDLGACSPVAPTPVRYGHFRPSCRPQDRQPGDPNHRPRPKLVHRSAR